MIRDGAFINILETYKEHNHDEVSDRKLAKDKIRNTCERKATKNICEKPSKIMRSALTAIENNEDLEKHDLPSVFGNVRRKVKMYSKSYKVTGEGINSNKQFHDKDLLLRKLCIRRK